MTADGTASETEARLASVLDTAVDGIIVIDEAGRILVFNKASEALFGYGADEVFGRSVNLIMPAAQSARHDAHVARYLATGERKVIGVGREVIGLHRDGTEIPIELSVGEADTQDGRQFIGILRDLTRRRDAERRLNQLQTQLVHLARVSAMDEMAAALAHEINQPLTATLLYLQAIRRRIAAASEVHAADDPLLDILAKAIREAERAGAIIERMRNFVEKREPERRPIDFVGLIEESLEFALAGTNAIEIQRDIAPDLPAIEADPVQIQQILVNLLRNAVEAVGGSENPWLNIVVSRDGGHLVFALTDSGPGIDPGVFANMFKAFATTKRSGMGLGLAISRSIAQNHGGDLVAEPGGCGRGACFRLRLPLAATAL